MCPRDRSPRATGDPGRPRPVTTPTDGAFRQRSAGGEPTDGRRARGLRSRAAVLERSVQLASEFGLEGLTIGALAADLGAHKSSVHALFGSKESLQLETVAAARSILIEQVIAPALPHRAGLPRLREVGDAWCTYLDGDVFSGGCFLCAASAEMDGRPGPVRDAVEAAMREWLAFLVVNIEAAIGHGDIRNDVDPAGLSFRLNALGMAANWQRQLLSDPSGIDFARTAWHDELDRSGAG